MTRIFEKERKTLAILKSSVMTVRRTLINLGILSIGQEEVCLCETISGRSVMEIILNSDSRTV